MEQERSIPTEEEVVQDYESATEQIMSVFSDPIFQKVHNEMMLEEVDF